jgi:predicted Rossmann fold nucleotide-binding protein DprA/Smf involved in DNA uptake
MHKPVYATPGSIFATTSAGILQRIEQGQVKPVVNLDGFLSTHFTKTTTASKPQTEIHLTDEEQNILICLSHDHHTMIYQMVQKI